MSPGAGSRDDMHALLDALVKFAQEVLDKCGEFFPFAASISRDGELSLAGAQSDSDRPQSQELIDMFEEAFRQAASPGVIRASAICVDVLIRPPDAEPTDAIEVRIEHRAADPVWVQLPYKKRCLRGIDYGRHWVSPGTPRIFT